MNLQDIIWTDPERVSGAVLFRDTRVPVRTLVDYLKGGNTLEEFLADFPGVTRAEAEAYLEIAYDHLVAPLEEADAGPA